MKAWLGLLLVLVLAACNASYKNVSVQDLASHTESQSLVIDVRQPEEYAQGHVPGAILMPLDMLESRLDELPKDEALYIICRSGNRSVQASELLLQKGFKDVRNVQGGTLAWLEAGYAVAY
jgi:rhodanese-related sulfurtransferase